MRSYDYLTNAAGMLGPPGSAAAAAAAAQWWYSGAVGSPGNAAAAINPNMGQTPVRTGVPFVLFSFSFS